MSYYDGSCVRRSGVHRALRKLILRYKRYASAGAVTRALCERGGRVLVKRKVISCDNGSCVRNKGCVHGALRRLIL
jgi:hypothetical protein